MNPAARNRRAARMQVPGGARVHPLRYERELRGWSQAKVAQEIGTTARTVYRWEHSQGVPYPFYRERLCLLFGKNAEELGLLLQDEPCPAAEISPASLPAPSAAPVPGEERPFLSDPLIPLPLAAGRHLIGRDTLLTRLKHRLCSGEHLTPIALQGLPGLGKTTLAVALACDPEIQRYYRDGILWVGLGIAPNVLGRLAYWGTQLGVSSTQVSDMSSWDAWGMALRATIGTRRMLLIIDDAWKAEEALAFQVGGPNCAHLITTRSPQIAFAVAGEETVQVPQLSEADGLTLLAHFAPEIMTLETERAHALVRSVGALPLALTLMGKYLGSQFFTGQPRRLHTAIAQLHDTEQRLLLSVPTPFIERSPSLPPGIPRSLHAAIAVSDEQLSVRARSALQALSIFPAKPNSFPEAMALAVMDETAEMLDELSDAGLLENSGPGRYTLHQTISDYASRMLKEPGVYKRWISFIADYIRQASYEQLDLEMPNIIAAFETAHTYGYHRELIQAICALIPFLHAHGLHVMAREYLLQAHTLARSLNDVCSIITISCLLGEIACVLGANALAEEHLQEGLALARAQGDQEQVARLLSTLANLATFRGKPGQAKIYAQEGLELARPLGKPALIVNLLTWMAWACHEARDYAQAALCCQEALPLARQINAREALCLLLAGMGWARTAVGNYAQAEVCHQEGLAIAQELQHRYCLCLHLIGQGWLAGKLGKYEQADSLTCKALALARQVSAYEIIYRLLTSLGWLSEKREAYAEADTYYQEALVLARQHANEKPRLLCIILSHIGKLRLKQQQFAEATAILQDTLRQIPASEQDLIERVQNTLAQVVLAQNQQRN